MKTSATPTTDPEHLKQAENGIDVPELCREHGMS